MIRLLLQLLGWFAYLGLRRRLSSWRSLINAAIAVALIHQYAIGPLIGPSSWLSETAVLLEEHETTINATELVDGLINLASSNESLNTLRSVREAIGEPNSLQGFHILYDIRTKLGNRPAKYLDIGSDSGVSASILFKHPYPTHVTAMDTSSCSVNASSGVKHARNVARKIESVAPTGCHYKSPWKVVAGTSPLPEEEGNFDLILITGNVSTGGDWFTRLFSLSRLRPGGFLVLDGYDEAKFQPEETATVHSILEKADLVALGQTPAIYGRSELVSINHQHIFRKPGTFKPKPQQVPSMPVLCVVAATYQRSDGSSPGNLETLWNMLEQQTFKNWMLYLTGDKYENEQEWKRVSFFNDSRASLYNLPEPGERNELRGSQLWLNGGSAALNESIRRALADGHEWVVQTGDDDIWDADHLENIYAGIGTGATFVTVSCQYAHNGYLPREAAEWRTNLTHDVPPRPCGVIAAAVAWNARLLHSKYVRDLKTPNDASLWARIVFEDKFYPVFVPSVSCYHLSERGSSRVKMRVRKSLMLDVPLPAGWHRDNGTDVFHDYHTVAAHEFPMNLSPHCMFVVGPEHGHPDFHLLDMREVPYHVRSALAFRDMPVWRKRG